MPLPPARLPTPKEGMKRRQEQMRATLNDLKEEYLEPLLRRFPRILPTKPDSAARYALYSAVIWFAIWMLFAAVTAIQLVYPKFLHQFAYFSFGRLRQAETQMLMWGVLFMGATAAAFAIVPRVCQVRLWSERIGAQLVIGLNQIVLAGTVLVLLGKTQGADGVEWPWPVDLGLVAAMLGILQILMFTVTRRKESALNTPARMLISAFHVLPITYAVANFATPYVIGVEQTFFTGFGWAGFLLGMSLVGLGAAMFVMPRATGNPLWSDRTANWVFWSVLFTMPWLGLAQRVLGPAQDWSETLGITFAIMMLVPAAFALALVIGTARGGDKRDPSSMFMTGGTLLWSSAVVLNLIGALRKPAAIVGATWWGESVRTLFLGAFGLWLVGLTYHMIPRIRGRALHSTPLVRAHFWVGTLGVAFAASALAVAGVVQGYVQIAGVKARAAFATGAGWETITMVVRPMLIARMAAGGLVFAGVVLLLVNVQQTLAEGREVPAEPVAPAPEAATAGSPA